MVSLQLVCFLSDTLRMRTTLLIILLHSLLLGLFGEVYAQTPKVDSLKALLSTAQGLAQIDLLNRIGDVASERYVDTAAVYARRALKLAKKQAYFVGIADAERVLGNFYIEKGELDSAATLFSSALSQYITMSNIKNAAICNKSLGNIYFKKGNYDKALEYYNLSLEQAKKIEDKSLSYNIQNNLASVYNKVKNYEKALEYYLPLAKYYEESNDSLRLAIILTNIGSSYIMLEDPAAFSRGVGFLMKSVQIRRMLGDKKGLAASYNNLAYVFANKGDFKKGIGYMQQSLDTYKEVGDKERIASSTYLIGELYTKAINIDNSLAEARKYTEAALTLAVEGNYKAIEIKSKVALAYIMDKQGNFVEAEKSFQDAYALLIQIGDSSQAQNVLIRSAHIQDTLADELLLKMKYEEAALLYKKAISTFEKFSSRRKLLNCYQSMIIISKKLKNKQDIAHYTALYAGVDAELKEELRKENEAKLAAAAAAEAEAEAKERARREAERQDRRQEEDDEED